MYTGIEREMKNYERHKGDDLLSNDSRLKYKWKWSRLATHIPAEIRKKWTHFQSSFCRIGSWELEAIQWPINGDVDYEARIAYGCNNNIADKRHFKTRIEAQIGAEKLLLSWLNKQKKLIKRS